MKALIVCPSPRPAVALLAEIAPLAVVPLLGKCLVEYWIEYLEGRGVRDLHILAADRPREIEAVVGDGTRWGLRITVEAEPTESSAEQAAETYLNHGKSRPDFIVQMDHLPGLPAHRLFDSYASWFEGLHQWIPLAQSLERIGQCEIEPGVWVGHRPRINPSARFLAPCWLGDHVSVGGKAVIGPGAIIEPAAIVGTGAHVTHSVIGPATFVGTDTRIENSIAQRDTLINWSTNSCLKVPDACWLSSLRGRLSAHHASNWHGPMRIQTDGDKLHISHLDELSAANSTPFTHAIREALTEAASVIEIDLACTHYMDSCGLATLCSLHRIASALGIRLRLLHLQPPMQQLLELTQMQELFTLDRPGEGPASQTCIPSATLGATPPSCPA